jgi:hypothetical protein
MELVKTTEMYSFICKEGGRAGKGTTFILMAFLAQDTQAAILYTPRDWNWDYLKSNVSFCT